MVLPAAQANVIREMATGGGTGGGITIHINGDVYDAGGVRALPSHPDFIRGMREARRNGVNV